VEVEDVLFDLLVLNAEVGFFKVKLIDLLNGLLVSQT
jgi:hypothetical protein